MALVAHSQDRSEEALRLLGEVIRRGYGNFVGVDITREFRSLRDREPFRRMLHTLIRRPGGGDELSWPASLPAGRPPACSCSSVPPGLTGDVSTAGDRRQGEAAPASEIDGWAPIP